MMWGPIVKDGRSQWPIYQDLGVGIYSAPLDWAAIATHRPIDPTNPNDPAYAWPEQHRSSRQGGARASHPRNLMAIYTPGWANGGRIKSYAPTDPADYTAFLTAAAKRYPAVHLWQIWGEPSRSAELAAAHAREPRSAAQRRAGEGSAGLRPPARHVVRDA